MTLSLRTKWALLGSSATAVGLALVGVALFAEDRVVSRNMLVRRLMAEAEIVAINSAAAIVFDDDKSAKETLGALRADPHVIAASIFRADGRLFVRYTRDSPRDLDVCVPELRDGATLLHRETEDFIFVERRILIDSGEPVGVLCMRSDVREIDERWQRYGLLVFLVLAGAWTVSYVLSFRLYNHAKTLEYKVRERERELEKANRELEGFSYFASHDLQAPLRQATQYAADLLEAVEAVASEEAKRCGERLLNRLEKARQLILALLALSRAGSQELRMVPIPLTPLMMAVARELTEAVPNRRIEWAIQAAMPTVMADAVLFRQVVVNLLDNAIKYSRDRDVAHIGVTADAANGEVSITVTDDGCGYDPKFQDRLWQPFKRLVGDNYQGHGCGLALVTQIISRHGGRVASEGWPDKGAQFIVTVKEAEQ